MKILYCYYCGSRLNMESVHKGFCDNKHFNINYYFHYSDVYNFDITYVQMAINIDEMDKYGFTTYVWVNYIAPPPRLFYMNQFDLKEISLTNDWLNYNPNEMAARAKKLFVFL